MTTRKVEGRRSKVDGRRKEGEVAVVCPLSLVLRPSSFVAIALVLMLFTTVSAQPQRMPPIDVTGATYVELNDATGIWVLRGNPVAVSRGTTTIRAATIDYDSRQQIVRASGGVSYADSSGTLTSAQATAWLQEERLFAEGNVSGVFREGAQETHMRSQSVEIWRKDRRAVATGDVIVRRGEFTLTAPRLEYLELQHKAFATGRSAVTAPEGRLSADRIEALLDREEAIAEGNVEILVQSGSERSGQPIEGRAPKAVLRRADGIAILSGGASIRQGQNTATALEITVDLRRNRVVATGQAHLVLYPR